MFSYITKRNILACYLSDIILGTYFQLPVWIAYQSQFLSFSQITFFAGLALATEVLAQIPSGAIADLLGRKLSLSLGNLGMALPMFLIAIYPSPDIMWIYAVLWGMGRAFCMGTSKPIVYESLEQEGKTHLYGKVLGKSSLAFQISAALSIIIGGYAYMYHPSLPYYLSGTFSLIGVFTALLFIEPDINRSKFNISQFIKKNIDGFKEIFRNSYISKYTLYFATIAGIANVSQQFFSQPYMVELGLSTVSRSWTAMLVKISIALLGSYIVTRSNLVNKKYFLLVIPSVMALSLLSGAIVTLPIAYLILIGIAFASGNTNSFLSPSYNHHIHSSLRSTSVSALSMIASSIGVFIQWISGPIISSSYVGNFYMYLGIFVLIFLLPLGFSILPKQSSATIAERG